MERGDGDDVADDGIISEDLTQLVEHIELTSANRLPEAHEWELAPAAADLEDAPILIGELRDEDPAVAALSLVEDPERFTETQADVTRLMPAGESLPGFAAERARWQKRVDALQAALEERDRRIAQLTAMLTALAPDSGQSDALSEPDAAEDETVLTRALELPPAAPVVPTTPTPAPHAAPALRRYLIGLDVVGCVHEVTGRRISIGRTRDNDLRIVDPTVSRLHAMVSIRNGKALLVDANSRNGIFVNGIQVRYAKLADGDLVTFGTVRFRYRVGSDSAGLAGSA